MTAYNIVAPQTTYGARIGVALPGMIDDMITKTTETRILESASAGFGLVVSQGTADQGAVLGGADPAKIIGVTVRDITLIHALAADMEKYLQRENMGVISQGRIWVNPGSNVAAGDPVYYAPASGVLSNAEGAAVVGAPGFTGTGNGVLTPATPAYSAGIKEGTYRVVAIQKVTNGGVFMVFDPDGDEVGQAVVGAAFVGPVKFTIADGSTDFEVNDTFTLGVTRAAEGPVPGARWHDTALAGGLARVHLGISK